ncbi:MAG: glycosyltransferase [Phycisphaerae bacterium]|nr:glycosyltransferase [Phycisphaerae bacterium]
MAETPLTSIIIATQNRRDVLLNTLAEVRAAAGTSGPYEIIVVVNRSRDGTVEAVRNLQPEVKLIKAPGNLGSCAKALGVEKASGRYILFLDDDSYPRPGSIERMIEHLEADHFLGAVGFQVHLPDGSRECSALPNVFVGCGVGFRACMLRDIGSLDPSLFMQAEEYDLAFRMISAGWRVECFADCHVQHLKTPAARKTARTIHYDTRNNLIVISRYLPPAHFAIYRRDWNQRYRWIAAANHRLGAHIRGLISGYACGIADRRLYRRLRLSCEAVETLFRFNEIHERTAVLKRDGVQRIVFAEFGKNIYPFFRAARQCGLEVLAIADDRFAGPKRYYREIPILPVAEALDRRPDTVIVSNTSPVHAAQADKRLSAVTDIPVHTWFPQ